MCVPEWQGCAALLWILSLSFSLSSSKSARKSNHKQVEGEAFNTLDHYRGAIMWLFDRCTKWPGNNHEIEKDIIVITLCFSQSTLTRVNIVKNYKRRWTKQTVFREQWRQGEIKDWPHFMKLLDVLNFRFEMNCAKITAWFHRFSKLPPEQADLVKSRQRYQESDI